MRTWRTTDGMTVVRVLSGVCACYLVVDGDRALLMDTGLRAQRRTLGRNLDMTLAAHKAQLNYVVLSHTHFDHADNVAHVARTYGSRVIVHRAEAGHLATGISPISPGRGPMARLVAKRYGRLIAQFRAYAPVKADILVDDAFDLSPYGLRARLFATPGHTMGSLTVLVDDQLALCGSAMLGRLSGSISLLFVADEHAKLASWRSLADTGCQTFLPSHGRPIPRRRLETRLKQEKMID